MRGLKYREVQALTEVEAAVVKAIWQLGNPEEGHLKATWRNGGSPRRFRRDDEANQGERLGAADEMEMALHGSGDPLHAVGA